MDPKRAVADDFESNAPAPAQGTVQADSCSTTCNHDGEAKHAFYQMMNDWSTQYIRTNPTVQQPPPSINPPQTPIMPTVNQIQLSRPPIEKIRKYGTEEFRATTSNDTEKAEF